MWLERLSDYQLLARYEPKEVWRELWWLLPHALHP